MKKPVQAIFLFLLIAGFLCFLAPSALIASYDILPTSFERPIGYADNVIMTKDRLYIVPHTPSGRIQIYDSDWKFIRGWRVRGYGGDFTVMPFDESTKQIEVITARGNSKYHFDLTGNELSKETYLPNSYTSYPKTGNLVWVATPFWLVPLSHPIIAWSLGVLGMLGLRLSMKTKLDQR
jgi:hypothetical protein